MSKVIQLVGHRWDSNPGTLFPEFEFSAWIRLQKLNPFLQPQGCGHSRSHRRPWYDGPAGPPLSPLFPPPPACVSGLHQERFSEEEGMVPGFVTARPQVGWSLLVFPGRAIGF